MTERTSLLVSSLLEPETTERLNPASWDILIRQARSAQRLVRLAVVLSEAHLLDKGPERPRQHLAAVLALHAHQQLAVRREVEHLLDAFEGRGLRLVLLKGAAYAMAGLPPGRCRLFADNGKTTWSYPSRNSGTAPIYSRSRSAAFGAG